MTSMKTFRDSGRGLVPVFHAEVRRSPHILRHGSTLNGFQTCKFKVETRLGDKHDIKLYSLCYYARFLVINLKLGTVIPMMLSETAS